MSWFDAEGLAEARADASRELSTPCGMYRAVRTRTATAKVTETWPDEPTATYSCRVRPTKGFSKYIQAVAGNAKQPMADYEIVLPWDADVTPFDRLKVNGIVYRILGTNSDQSDRTLLISAVTSKGDTLT
jgi:Phage head-tail joining protein